MLCCFVFFFPHCIQTVSTDELKYVSITLIHCSSITPSYGYNVNALRIAAHPVVYCVSKKLQGGLHKHGHLCQCCWMYRRYETSLSSLCCHGIWIPKVDPLHGLVAVPSSVLSHAYVHDLQAASSPLLM